MSREARRFRPRGDAGTGPAETKETDHDHLDHDLPDVRHPGRRGGEALHLALRGKDQGHDALPGRRAAPGGRGPLGDLRAARPDVRRPQRRPHVHLLAGLLAHGAGRHPGGDRPPLEEPDRRWRQGGAVRLARRQVRRLLADRPPAAPGAARGQGPGEVRPRDAGDDGDAQARVSRSFRRRSTACDDRGEEPDDEIHADDARAARQRRLPDQTVEAGGVQTRTSSS